MEKVIRYFDSLVIERIAWNGQLPISYSNPQADISLPRDDYYLEPTTATEVTEAQYKSLVEDKIDADNAASEATLQASIAAQVIVEDAIIAEFDALKIGDPNDRIDQLIDLMKEKMLPKGSQGNNGNNGNNGKGNNP